MRTFSVLGFVVASPIVLDLVDSELHQTVALWIAAMASGYLFGKSAPDLPVVGYVVTGAIAGVLSYAAVVLYVTALYPSATDLPYGIWLARFAIPSALAFAGGAFLGSTQDRAGLAAVLELGAIAIGMIGAGVASAG